MSSTASLLRPIDGFLPASSNTNAPSFPHCFPAAVIAAYQKALSAPFSRGTLRIHSNEWTYTRIAAGHYRLELTKLVEDGDVTRDLGSVYVTSGNDQAMRLQWKSGVKVRDLGFLTLAVRSGRLVTK